MYVQEKLQERKNALDEVMKRNTLKENTKLSKKSLSERLTTLKNEEIITQEEKDKIFKDSIILQSDIKKRAITGKISSKEEQELLEQLSELKDAIFDYFS